MGKFRFRFCKGFIAAAACGILLMAAAAVSDNEKPRTAACVPENPLQIILSPGVQPGQLSISWKGDSEGPEA